MALTRWEPFALDLPDRWKKFFDFAPDGENWMRVEEIHEGDTLVVRAELPGVDPDKDVDISVSDGVLHIEGRREESTEDKKEGSYRSEFRYGKFSRDLALPKGVESKQVKATYRDGILEVRIPWPVTKAQAPERVAISRS
ncbi:MAG: Hsp20/alpha crystallin family protein [Acidimicrobiales bacterium]|jgi:HSP20 family protein